jgi:hypothetical protein
MACFHIRWSDSKLDWECHTTRAEAQTRAQELAKPNETFSIERFQDGKGAPPCPNLRVVPGRIGPRERAL